jgi:mannose-6-phosphate isomerase-like protein (cupin superfamily)
MIGYITKFSDSKTVQKYGVSITLYPSNRDDANIVYEEVLEGHFEEFLSTKSTYTWFIIDGEGTFVVNDEKFPVVEKDIVTIPPNNRIHYFGKMKMLLFTVPAFDEKNERHIRDVQKEESPYFKKS